MIESFDNGYEQGLTEGTEKTLGILQELRSKNLSISEIAEKFNIKVELVLQLRDLL
jgi:predicted transposase YdaD